MMKLFWVGVVIAFAFAQMVTGFLDFNETELSLIEAYEYGVSKLNYNPLMVGLTLIRSAGAKGAEVELNKDGLLDEAVDALYEKWGSTREKSLAVIIEACNSNLQHQFLEQKFATLLHPCLNSFKKGSSKEIALASHTIECLAIITFVGMNDPEETEKSIQIMWQLVYPKLGSNVIAVKPSATVIIAVVSAWSFLLTTMDGWRLSPKLWQQKPDCFYYVGESFLVIDMHPGTGDIQLTLCQVVPLTAAVIVTTPQKLAFINVAKGVRMFSKLKVSPSSVKSRSTLQIN
ncbi:hypothetical protein REPUB_Repub12eG0018600 [Reevesia pubescens]